MNDDFRINWNWQLQLMDDIKEILRGQAMHIVDIEVATPEEDMKQATDMKTKITAGDVAVRIRRDIKWRELTIRAKLIGHMGVILGCVITTQNCLRNSQKDVRK